MSNALRTDRRKKQGLLRRTNRVFYPTAHRKDLGRSEETQAMFDALAKEEMDAIRMSVDLKLCRGCERVLPASDFRKRNREGDGYDTRCKRCRGNAKAKIFELVWGSTRITKEPLNGAE